MSKKRSRKIKKSTAIKSRRTLTQNPTTHSAACYNCREVFPSADLSNHERICDKDQEIRALEDDIVLTHFHDLEYQIGDILNGKLNVNVSLNTCNTSAKDVISQSENSNTQFQAVLRKLFDENVKLREHIAKLGGKLPEIIDREPPEIIDISESSSSLVREGHLNKSPNSNTQTEMKHLEETKSAESAPGSQKILQMFQSSSAIENLETIIKNVKNGKSVKKIIQRLCKKDPKMKANPIICYLKDNKKVVRLLDDQIKRLAAEKETERSIENVTEVLHLVLSYTWFDKIFSGQKVREFRADSDWIRARLKRNYDAIRFTRGYTSAPWIMFEYTKPFYRKSGINTDLMTHSPVWEFKLSKEIARSAGGKNVVQADAKSSSSTPSPTLKKAYPIDTSNQGPPSKPLMPTANYNHAAFLRRLL